jgi:Streptomyces sporulation and cell division protein, SsgA
VSSTAPLTRALRLHLVVAGEESVPVDAALSYLSSDPYAVTAVFHADESTPVTWTFGRDLLAAGLAEPSGEGDVGIWPSTSRGAAVVCMALSSPSGHALLEASRADVETFLAASYALVPSGTESAHLDLDQDLLRLLAG